jgi:hypothetical protein
MQSRVPPRAQRSIRFSHRVRFRWNNFGRGYHQPISTNYSHT